MTEQEQKARFFAQYYGQQVYVHNLTNSEEKIEERHLSPGYVKNGYLLLTPLSAITPEHDIELLNIIATISSDNFLNGILGGNYTKNVSMASEAIDYLRSKGYALPFMGHTVEEMESKGWLKLKEVV